MPQSKSDHSIGKELTAIRREYLSPCTESFLYHYTSHGDEIRQSKQFTLNRWSPFEMERALFQGINVISNRLLTDEYLAEAGWILRYGQELLQDVSWDVLCFSHSPKLESLWNRCATENGECFKLHLDESHPWQNLPDVADDPYFFLAPVSYDSQSWWEFYETLWQKLDEVPTEKLFAVNARLSSWNIGNDSLLRVLFLLDYILPILPFINRPDFAKEQEIRLVRFQKGDRQQTSVPLGKNHPLSIQSFVKKVKSK